MRPYRTKDAEVHLAAAACVAAALAPTTWWTRFRLRIWVRQSEENAVEFLIAASITEAIRGLDKGYAIDIAGMLEELDQTVVPLKAAIRPEPAISLAAPGRIRMAIGRQLIRGIGKAHPKRKRSFSLRRTAAALLLLPLIPFLAPSAPLPGNSDFATSVAETRRIVLEAGSVIYLNANSAVSISHLFGGYNIEVHQGEVLFDIKHNARRRLWVRIGNVIIEDVGTRFDIQKSATEDRATVSVFDGTLKIGTEFDRSVDSSGALSKHDRTAFEPACSMDAGTFVAIGQLHKRPRFERRKFDPAAPENQAIWTKGWLTFNGETLARVVQSINERNLRKIVIEDPSISRLRVGGRFLAGDIDSSVRALTFSLPIRVLRSDDATQSNTIRLVRADVVGSHPTHKAIAVRPLT